CRQQRPENKGQRLSATVRPAEFLLLCNDGVRHPASSRRAARKAGLPRPGQLALVPMGKLEGKIALVTGSGRNIGRATVLKLAREGAHVVVNARSNQQEAEAVAREARDLGVKAVPVLADVGKRVEVEALAARALSEFGRVDILINNAAIRPHTPFTQTTDADWE